MAVNTSKFNLQHIYSLVAYHFGGTIADATEFPLLDRVNFIRMVNEVLDDIASATDTVERLVLLTPDRRWLRYIKITPEELNNGIVRIDLEGQTPTLLSSDDPDNLDWQYENPCTGDGTDPDYDGESAAPIRSPDAFPEIYFPAESNIPATSYPNLVGGVVTFPAGAQSRIGGGNEPLTPFVIDMRKVGYGSGTVGDDDYPTETQTHLYFRDIFYIGALLCVNWTQGGITYASRIPHSNDAYLNDTWATILDTAAGAWVLAVNGAGTFIVDGVTWTTTIVNNTYNATTGVAATLRITSGAGEAFDYDITPGNTPWADVVAGPVTNPPVGVHIWHNLFGNQALYSNRGWYVKVKDFVLRMPDDMRKIKWLWKVPLNSRYIDIPTTEYKRLQFAALTTGPTIGSTITQAVTGATMVVSSFDLTNNYVYGADTGIFDTTNAVTGGGMVPSPNVPTAVDIHYLTDSTTIGDAEYLMYSRYDEAYHYFPITESRFTQLKYLETQGHDFRGAGFYIQFGQQLRLVPRPADLKSALIAMLYEAKPDNIDESTVMANFATTYVELPSSAVKAIQYRIQASIYASSRGGGNMDQAATFFMLYEKELQKLENLYGGRQRQSYDAPSLKNALDPFRNTRHFGLGYTSARSGRGRNRR